MYTAPVCVRGGPFTIEKSELRRWYGLGSLASMNLIVADCCEACSSDPDCLLVVESVTRNKECHIAMEQPTFRLARTEGELASQRTIQVKHSTMHRDYCDVCHCDKQLLVDCHARDLSILPTLLNTSWGPRELDQRRNPMLRIIGACGLFPIGTELRSLRLPVSLDYLANETINRLSQLAEISFESNDVGEEVANNDGILR